MQKKHDNVILENLFDVPPKQVCLPPYCYIQQKLQPFIQRTSGQNNKILGIRNSYGQKPLNMS